ncbi:MipA/OmpV family protein [Ochrobactrum sp. RH2CCR150]|uniref:MipA/OmpV family protein n=1 Tax=Ochrobactrum sp. RH2CCR150 TaxID=2587044 RepID=UPI0015FA0822|nr:outer membrane scaffolding protein for murein synthesis (MipA/OmpV family) [Ochrobactrum sp. RH2CCR150]
MVQINRWVYRGVALACLFVTSNTMAADQSTTSAPQEQRGWIITLGAGTEYGPSYEGAHDKSFSFVPSFDIRRFGEAADLSAPDDNIDYSLFELGGVEIGPVASIRGNRKPSDDPSLQGLHEIRWSVDAGAFAQYWAIQDKLRFRVEARQGFRRDDGFVADLGADWFQRAGKDLIFSVGPRLSFANATYMQNSFGVSAGEVANGAVLPAYDARGGVKSVGVVASVTYQLTDTMSIQAYDKFERLVGDAVDSPIVTQGGSPNQNSIGIILSRSFEFRF